MIDIILYAVVLPLVISFAVLWGGHWWLRSSSRGDGQPLQTDPRQELANLGTAPCDGSKVAGLAVALPYMVCHVGVHGWPSLQRVPEAWEWLLLLVPASAIANAVGGRIRGFRWPLYVVLALLAGWLLVPSFQDHRLTWRIGLAGTVLAWMWVQSMSSPRLPDIVLPVVWVLLGSLGLPLMIASANAKFGFFLTSVAAASGGMIVAMLFCRAARSAQGAIPVVSVLFPAVVASGYFNDYGGVPWQSFALAVASPMGLLMAWGVPRIDDVAVGADRHVRRLRWGSIGVVASVVAIAGLGVYYAWPALHAEPAYY